MRRLHDASTAFRRAARIVLSSYFTNGLVTALGIPFASVLVGHFFGPLAAAYTETCAAVSRHLLE